MTIEDFGAHIVSVWEGLRPRTRSIVERAFLSAQTSSAGAASAAPRTREAPYDARAESELSRLLTALDNRAAEAGQVILSTEQLRELRSMAETCALVLHNESRSAEVYAQLLERVLNARNYAGVDALADTLPVRLAPSEVCELARHPNRAVRAIAQEALLQIPTSVLIELLSDPIDSDIAREALKRQAGEYGSEEARWIVNELERAMAAEDDT